MSGSWRMSDRRKPFARWLLLAGWMAVWVAHGSAAAALQPGHDDGSQIVLTVVDDRDQPIAGARVEVEYQLTTDPRSNTAEPHFRNAMSDNDGLAVLKLEDGVRRLAITCRATGKVAHALVRYSERPDQPLKFPFEHTVKLSAGRPISGQVVDSAGSPVADASVFVELLPGDVPELLTDHDHFAYGRVTSDNQGRWEVAAFPDNAELQTRLVFDHPDFIGPTIVEQVQSVMTVQLPQSASIRGTVTDDQSRPIPGATVRFADFVWATHVPSATTDANGRYEIKGCWPGQASLTVQADDFAAQSMLAVASLEGSDEQDFQLQPSAGFSGRLVDSDGQPVAGAIVRCGRWNGRRNLRWQTRSDEAGRFEWSDAPAGEFSFEIIADGFLIVTDHVVAADHDSSLITLQPVFQVAGRVLDADSHKPVDNVLLQYGPRRQDGTWDFNSPIMVDGRYVAVFEQFADSYQIVLSVNGYETRRLTSLTAGSGSDQRDVSLKRVTDDRARRYSGWGEIEQKIEAQEFDMQQAAALTTLRELGAYAKFYEWGDREVLRIRLVDEHVAGRRRGGVEEIRREPDRKSWRGSLADLVLLNELDNAWLILDGWEIDTAVLEAVGALGPLESLELTGVWDMEPKEFSAFEVLDNVRRLQIDGAWQAFPHEGLVALSRLPNLNSLEFRGGNQLTGQAFAGLLRNFDSLTEFRVQGLVDPVVLDEISQMESLESLRVGCKFDDRMLLKLPDNPHMKHLDFRGTGISDAGLAKLIERYPDLEFLWLRETSISRRCLRLLTQRPLSKLRQLFIGECPRPEVVELQRAHPDCIITQTVDRPRRPRGIWQFELRRSERRQAFGLEQ